MIRFCAAFVVAMTTVTFASVAPLAAQQPTEQLDEAARLTFESAREAFVAGDYERALGLFRQAYNLSPRPGLLYNIAQTLDRLRRDAETLQALREYLEAYPEAPNRTEVEARIRVLEQSVAADEQRRAREQRDHERAVEQARRDGTEPPPPPGGGLGVLHPAIFIAVGGVALVGGGLAIWSGLETSALNDRYRATSDPAMVGQAYSDAESMQTLANVFIFSSAGLAAVAVVLAIFTDWDAFGGGSGSAARVRPTFAADVTGGRIGLEGSF
ncbi:MAG: hypothetical protein KF729_00170 [Sandaracinaceae bacterium]|nr:hypothetical protein [Sandaracinaceae bacterium]